MLFLLLPLILNPFGLIIRWLPALYLMAWPIIIQTLGQEALLLHAIILIMFILCCDITRGLMLKLIGFDLISLPAGVALLAVLLSDRGTTLLSYIVPICTALLVVMEPIFLLIETLIVMDMLKAVNRWISRMSNIRDEESNDLSNWEPPLTRGSILIRFLVILISIASYLGTYMLVQESKALLGFDDKSFPVQFNQAIALLVTLQLIAFTTTIYKEEGILSESAMVALIAAVPIFVASWSFYHLKTTAANPSLGWSSYFPFSLFASGGGDASEIKSSSFLPSHGSGLGLEAQPRIVFVEDDLPFGGYQSHGSFGGSGGATFSQLDYGALERSIHLLAPSDNFFKQALLAFVRQLIMLINSVLGLSWDKLAKYYFGPDFWYILSGRLVCLIWWAVCCKSTAGDDPEPRSQSSNQDSHQGGLVGKFKRFFASLPLGKSTLIKCLIVLAYAQMLIQQMENKHSMAGHQTSLLSSSNVDEFAADEHMLAATSACCSHASQTKEGSPASIGPLDSATGWLGCMWQSARACSTSTSVSAGQPTGSRASRFLEGLMNLLGQALGMFVGVFAYAYQRVTNAHTSLYFVYALWLTRWRSPIIQRLMQSVFIQLYYIGTLLLGANDQEDVEEFTFL